jgi:hypothetical protein
MQGSFPFGLLRVRMTSSKERKAILFGNDKEGIKGKSTSGFPSGMTNKTLPFGKVEVRDGECSVSDD